MSVTLLAYKFHGSRSSDFLFDFLLFSLSFVSLAPHVDLGTQ